MGPKRTLVDGPIQDPLPKLREKLSQEFGSIPNDTIEFVARQALLEFDAARIRDYVPVFAWRRARQALRAKA
jgi:Protein of unknown function (DUF3562)